MQLVSFIHRIHTLDKVWIYVQDLPLTPLVPLIPLVPLVPLVPLIPPVYLLGTLLLCQDPSTSVPRCLQTDPLCFPQ